MKAGVMLQPQWIAALAAVAVGACYLLSAQAEIVPWCNPFWDGCTSISRASRDGAAYWVFKVLMLPVAIGLALYWWRYTAAWLPHERRRLRGFGVTAALFLLLYVLALGHEGEWFFRLRRLGVTTFFVFTVIAQMLVLRADWRSSAVANCYGRLLILVVLWGLGLASLLVSAASTHVDRWENVLEWWFATALFLGIGLLQQHKTRP